MAKRTKKPVNELALKHARLVSYLDRSGLDGVILARRCNFSWYTCGAHNHVGEAADVGVSHLVIKRDGAWVVANNIEAGRLADEELPKGIKVRDYHWYDGQARRSELSALVGSGRFGADAAVDGIRCEPLLQSFDWLRWQMEPPEIDRYRVLCQDVAGAVEGVARKLKPGLTEFEAAGRMSDQLRQRDCLPWVVLVGSDERIASFRHPLPTGAKMKKLALLVTVAERRGLMAAVSRLVAFGKIAKGLQRKLEAVGTVDVALIGSTHPGTTLGDIFAAAQAAYAQVGFPDEWKRHHQGGSIGYLPREMKASPGCPAVVLPDQPFAWNPSVPGAKCEDTILCRSEGCEVLTHTGKWPTFPATWNNRTIRRPGILVV